MSRTTPKQDLLRDIESYTCGETPSAMDMLRAPVIDEWICEVRRRGKEFVMVVKGVVKRHPEYTDGDMITTPAVQWFDRKGKFVRTALRLYALGEPAGEEIPIDGVDI
jgi:hypothetical protein